LINDPGSDRIVAEMGRLGAHCAVVGPANSFAAKSRFALRLFALPGRGGSALRSLVLGSRLAEIVRAWLPDMIIPIDDLAARVLRDRRLVRGAGPELRRLLEYSLGAAEYFDIASGRQGVMDIARSAGVRTPLTAATPSLAEAKRAAAKFGYPVVLKRELTCGGRGVAIVHRETDLENAYRQQKLRAEAKRSLGWIPGFGLADAAPLSVQRFVPGALAFRVIACADGEELEGADFVAVNQDLWETRASTMVRAFDHEEIRSATRKIVAALKCSGLVSLDFILNEANEAYFLELNARPIACSHLGRLFGHDILSAALHRTAGAPVKRPELSQPPEVVALFPRAIDREPRGRLLEPGSTVHHDVPWEDQEIVRAYSAWLDRRHPDQRPVLRPRGGLVGSAIHSRESVSEGVTTAVSA
jgi:formate-dependent phosphoribosylglycinamide formyltransferase (GAR transformylase)